MFEPNGGIFKWVRTDPEVGNHWRGTCVQFPYLAVLRRCFWEPIKKVE
jgi:hypothetical protein